MNDLIIQCVREVPMLYDKICHEYYKDKTAKQLEYCKIASYLSIYGLETTGEAVEAIWKSLKAQFKKLHLLKTQTRSGSELPETEEWEYYQQLLFLAKQVEPRPTCSTLNAKSTETTAATNTPSVWQKSYVTDNTISHPVPPKDAFASKKEIKQQNSIAEALGSLEQTVCSKSDELIQKLSSDGNTSIVDDMILMVLEGLDQIPEEQQEECFIELIETFNTK